ncbi:MAG: hypothetical protein JWN44_1166 [Myxococcales bacterium]|nr:hypothetical protein [Myxococcales bacterium]
MDRLRLAWVACVIGIASGCHTQDAVLLSATADAPVEQYQLFVFDDDTQTPVYSSGFSAVSTPGLAPLDLTRDQLKLALKLSRGGHFTLLLVGVIGEVQNGKPSAAASVLFWGGKVHVDGSTDVKARLLTVPPGDDADGDYWPDRTAFMQHVPEAAALYANTPNVLDCNDDKNMPVAPDGTVVALDAAQINPFAVEICGDGYDENCSGDADEACIDKDGDHDTRGHDCDDNDPKRHRPTDIDPFPDPPNCCGYSLGRVGTAEEHTNFLGQDICPTQRCGDGIDESCRNSDTTCIVDADCDGYPATVNGQPYDCDDSDPTVHPGAVEACGSTKDLNCNGSIGEGCVPCDLDGDGYQRVDAPNGCPDTKDKHPGMSDCNDDDAGVFPGATSVAGGNEGGVSVGKVAAGLRGFCRSIYEPKAVTGTAKINPFGAAGDADCNGKAYEGCPALIDPMCDKDGDGWPGVATVGTKNCNPNNVTLDCDDNDPTTFPSAPINCKSNRPTYKENCTPQGTPDCTGDADGDGYAAPADCDDKNPAIHPWALELCDGIDNDCDGLVDEGNPDPSGAPLVTSGVVSSCTDSNTGECAKQKGTCVCSIAQPVKDPLLGTLNRPRLACSGEGAPVKATGCFGAGQPKPQSCDSIAPKDDDCDGRVDAPDGARLAVKGMTCGINVGQCKAGIVVACDMTKPNCFSTFGRTAPNTSWYQCSGAAPDPVTVCPVAELCNGLDDDCDGTLAGSAIAPAPGSPSMDERDHDADKYLACTGCPAGLAPGILGCYDCNDSNASVHPGATEICNAVDDACAVFTGQAFMDGKDDCGKGANLAKGTCCGGNGCRDTTSDFMFCSNCTTACTATNADRCYMSSCSCGMTGTPCAAGLTCTGGVCTKGPGSACSGNGECTPQAGQAAGRCIDGHCCSLPDTSASCGTCRACTGAGGICVNQGSGLPGNLCPDAGGNTVCNGGGACKKNLAQACGSGAECYNNICVDGYCCNTTCSSQCNACNVTPGTCTVVTGAVVNLNMPARTACTGSGTCAGTCDGTNLSCQLPGSMTPCGSQTCTQGAGGAVVTLAGSCSAGSCSQVSQPACTYTQCAGTSCATTCAGDTDCVAGFYCDSASHCTAQKAGGSSCTPATDCYMGGACRECTGGANRCVDNVCCDKTVAMCNLDCQRCNALSSAGNGVCGAATAGTPGRTACANNLVCTGISTMCPATCATDAQCAAGFWCKKDNTCQPQLASGANCMANDCNVGMMCRMCAGDKACTAGNCP